MEFIRILLVILVQMAVANKIRRIPFNNCCDVNEYNDSCDNYEDNCSSESSCIREVCEGKRHCCRTKRREVDCRCYSRRRDHDCSIFIKEIEAILRLMPLNMRILLEEAMDELIVAIIEIIRGMQHRRIVEIKSEIDDLTRSVERCLDDHTRLTFNEINVRVGITHDEIIRDMEKSTAASSKTISTTINTQLALADADLVTYVRDPNNGLLPFLNGEMLTLSNSLNELVEKSMAKLRAEQKREIGELLSKLKACIVAAIIETGKNIKKSFIELLEEIFRTIKGGIVGRILRSIETKLNMQFLRDNIAIVSHIKRYVKCITCGRYGDDIPLDAIAIESIVQQPVPNPIIPVHN